MRPHVKDANIVYHHCSRRLLIQVEKKDQNRDGLFNR